MFKISALAVIIAVLLAGTASAETKQLRGETDSSSNSGTAEIDKIQEQKDAAYQPGHNVGSTTCGGNCPGGCADCPCGSSSSYQSISTWCSKYSWNQANCECVMQNESGGNANAVNQNGYGGSYDVGLWQINDYNWNACSGGKAPCDPNANLDCAIDVYKWGGNTWSLWSTCSKCGCCNSA